MYLKVEVYIPADYEERLMEALNAQGLLGAGAYDHVYASTPVTGHFRPLPGAKPFSGSVGIVAREPEQKVEFRILASHKKVAKDIILRHHPYEEPVIFFIPLD